MFDELVLILFGAGIALVTSIVTNYLEYHRRETTRKRELLETLLERVGHAGALGMVYESRNSDSEFSNEEIKQAKYDYVDKYIEMIKEAKGDNYYYAYLRGIMESQKEVQLQNLEYLDNQYIKELEEKVERLEEQLKELQTSKEEL